LEPAIGLYLIAALLGATHRAWVPRLRAASPGAWAGSALAGVGVLTLLLHPSLVHYAEKAARREIEREDAPTVLRQPEWRQYVLTESRRRVDSLRLLEGAGTGSPLLVDELAFAVWASTDLAAFGFSSAVEIQDPSGLVISRFALNLPTLSGPPKPMPESDAWTVSAEPLSLASLERRALHARRRLSYHGELHGAVHLYVGDDFWNLPFVKGRDPYSILYRISPKDPGGERSVQLFAYGWNRDLIFSSVDRPPVLTNALVERVRQGPFWTTLAVQDGPQHTYLFSDSHGIYGLGYPRIGAGRFASDLVEALTGMLLSATAALVALVLVRTALRRSTLSLPAVARGIRERFSLRLFVAFIAVAALPVIVLEFVVRGFVADRLRRESETQALERAAVARRVVEDFAYFQRGEAPGRQPVSDAALVWVASLIRNDLDLFEKGRLLASSKRELYASGLLPSRVSGTVFRTLALEGQPAVLGAERIGGFSYMVVAVPVKLDPREPGILSIPLALRQREVEAVLADLDRTVRLASIVFLAAAAALAHSMARRISGPVRDLTEAARRIARGDLEARVSTSSRDEFLGLVDSFNRMAGDLERQRRDLERSNRLAAWAEMARQVAHEVKNPLTPIQLSAEHLRRVYRDSGADFKLTLEACTESILQQVGKLREMVTEFSAFARPPASAPEKLDLRGLVQDVIKPYAHVLPPGVTLTIERPESELPPVHAERRLLERALVNLLENALQAVGESGRITIRVRELADGQVEVEVEDSGPGLDADVHARAFEPFFSTKTGGSGLGLALVRKIAQDHGGGATIDAQPGRTRARIWLPADRQRKEGRTGRTL
jgi:signal transduction histidine kinase